MKLNKTFTYTISGYSIKADELISKIENFADRNKCSSSEITVSTFSSYSNYEDSASEIVLKYIRPETDEEYFSRLELRKKIEESYIEAEKQEYERLKKIYGK